MVAPALVFGGVQRECSLLASITVCHLPPFHLAEYKVDIAFRVLIFF